MNKFIIGDLVYLPQNSHLYQDRNRILACTVTKPMVATYLGSCDEGNFTHKLDVYGVNMYVSAEEIETLNFARKDVYKTNSIN